MGELKEGAETNKQKKQTTKPKVLQGTQSPNKLHKFITGISTSTSSHYPIKRALGKIAGKP